MNIKLILFVGSVFLSINGPLHASKDPIINRIQNMQKADRAMILIKKNISDFNYPQAALHAKDIMGWADKMLHYFPSGSEASNINYSSASNHIWEEFEDFKAYIKDKKRYAKEILNAARSKNIHKLLKNFRDLSKTCNRCHEKFRD